MQSGYIGQSLSKENLAAINGTVKKMIEKSGELGKAGVNAEGQEKAKIKDAKEIEKYVEKLKEISCQLQAKIDELS